MSNLTPDEYQRYKVLAAKHADFLCTMVFTPAFIMAFMHGAKHMKEDMNKGSYVAEKELSPPFHPRGD